MWPACEGDECVGLPVNCRPADAPCALGQTCCSCPRPLLASSPFGAARRRWRRWPRTSCSRQNRQAASPWSAASPRRGQPPGPPAPSARRAGSSCSQRPRGRRRRRRSCHRSRRRAVPSRTQRAQPLWRRVRCLRAFSVWCVLVCLSFGLSGLSLTAGRRCAGGRPRRLLRRRVRGQGQGLQRGHDPAPQLVRQPAPDDPRVRRRVPGERGRGPALPGGPDSGEASRKVPLRTCAPLGGGQALL